MDLRKTVSYHWRLFIPLAASLWLCLLVMIGWQLSLDREMRIRQLHDELSLANQHVINAYEQNYNPLPYIDFVAHNYTEKPLFEALRMSVYLDGHLYYNIGEVIDLYSNPSGGPKLDARQIEEASNRMREDNFFYATKRSGDDRLVVYTVVPFDDQIANLTFPNKSIIYVLVAIGLFLTGVAYAATQHLGKTIKNMSIFAQQAATNPEFIVSNIDFPHDQLGDIGRQIAVIFNDRQKLLERIRHEHEVAMHAMEDKAQVKRQLTNNINHELKTPIGVIKGYLDTIIQNPDMDEATRMHFTKKTLEHANRLVTLINDVSTITRLEEGANLVTTEPLDYHDVAYTVASDIADSGELGNMDFNYDIPLDCRIMGNYNLLIAMLHNLAKNAAAYSKGTECGVLFDHEDNDFCWFRFYDNGNGVPEEHLPHLFERFYRIDSGRSRKSGGTGLGLPIVENTVLAHGGTISVMNGPEGGLSFLFSLRKAKERF